GRFGYQVGPELWALEEPAQGDSGPGLMLERQTFPVLLIFALDDEDVRPRLRWRGGKLEVLEPHLMLVQSTRWLPLEECSTCKWLSETERLRWSRELARVPEALAAAEEAGIPAATRRL